MATPGVAEAMERAGFEIGRRLPVPVGARLRPRPAHFLFRPGGLDALYETFARAFDRSSDQPPKLPWSALVEDRADVHRTRRAKLPVLDKMMESAREDQRPWMELLRLLQEFGLLALHRHAHVDGIRAAREIKK